MHGLWRKEHVATSEERHLLLSPPEAHPAHTGERAESKQSRDTYGRELDCWQLGVVARSLIGTTYPSGFLRILSKPSKSIDDGSGLFSPLPHRSAAPSLAATPSGIAAAMVRRR